MPVAVIDSNVLIGVASRRDVRHEQSRSIVEAIDTGRLPTVRVTNYVLAEVLNYLTERHGNAIAIDLFDRLKAGSGFELVQTTKAVFHQADGYFRRFDRLSFVDAVIVAYMHDNDSEYLYSFDDDFDGVERLTRLETTANPFD